MDLILMDWKFWAFLLQGGITIAGFMLIKFNDFKHLTKDVEQVSQKVDCLDKKVGNLKTDIAVLQEKTKVL